MAQATSHNITPLSALFTDPDVRSAFWRAEQDVSDDLAALVEVDNPRQLDGGAAERLCRSVHRSRALVWRHNP